MSEPTTPTAPETPSTEEAPSQVFNFDTAPTGADALIAFQREQEADRADRQAAAEEAIKQARTDTAKATADREREAYLKATEPTRNAPGYTERYQAYDRIRLAFIEGTAADTSKEAIAKAKALPAYADAKTANLETRPI